MIDHTAPAATIVCSQPTDRDASLLWSRRDSLVAVFLVIVALCRGLLFATVQWPWYAPDEPDHAEYALLIQRHGPLVDRSGLDPALRLAIATSLYQWRVYERLPAAGSDLTALWTGEIGRQPPLYYSLAGAAASLAPPGDLLAQLFAMRTISALLGALLVGLLYLAGRLLAPTEPLLGLGLAGFSLTQTTLGGLAGAATNDGLVAFMATLVLMLAVALVRPAGRRHRLLLLLGLAVALALALLSKRTAVAVIPAVLLVPVLGAAPAAVRWLRHRRLLAPAVAVTLALPVLIFAALIGWDESQPRDWGDNGVERVLERAVPDGRAALRLPAGGEPQAAQLLVDHGRRRALGEPVTFGVWLRRDGDGPRPITLRLRWRVGERFQSQRLRINPTAEWEFYRHTATIPSDADTISVSVMAEPAGSTAVLVDDAILTLGHHEGAPERVAGGGIAWSGAPVENLLVNPSFEESMPVLRPQARTLLRTITHLDVDQLYRVAPPDTVEKWQVRVVEPFFQSLWGRLGRLAELVMPAWWYMAHALLLAAAILGGIFGAVRAAFGRRLRRGTLLAGALLGAQLVGAAVVAIGPYLLGIYSGPPFGRYFLVAILPLALLYVGGFIWPWPRRLRPIALLALLVALAALDAYALFYELPNHFAVGGPRPG